MSAAELEWMAAWETTLAELELAVDEAEAMLRVGHLLDAPAPQPWTPPTHNGPLPASLEQRARTLLGRQSAVARELALAMRESRRQDRALQRLKESVPAPPVYVDVPA